MGRILYKEKIQNYLNHDQKIEELGGINLTSTRMNKTRAGGIFYQWLAGNDDGDFMGDDAELYISPTSTGYYLLGCMSKRGYGTNFQTGAFDIIAEEVPADTFTADAGTLIILNNQVI